MNTSFEIPSNDSVEISIGIDKALHTLVEVFAGTVSSVFIPEGVMSSIEGVLSSAVNNVSSCTNVVSCALVTVTSGMLSNVL